MGYSVVHSTTHGPAEEGKDIIARDARERVMAFQLKRGNINVTEWQKIIPQITELVEYPVRHPSIRPNAKHRPVLVTTGFINEHVTSRIDNMNRNFRQRKFNELETWSGSEVLMKFIDHTGSFLPEPIAEFHRLLGMMIKTGDGPLDKNEFDFLLRSILPLGHKKGTAKERELARKIRAAAVILEFALAGYDCAGNQFAKIEAYVLFACYLRAVRMRYKIRNEVLEPTMELMENAIDDCARNMWHEARKMDAFGQGGHITEPFVAPYRNTILYGALAAHGLWCMMGGKSSWYENEKEDLAKEMVEKGTKILLASEAFVPAKFLISELLRHNGYVKEGNNMFKEILRESVLRKLSNAGQRPLWDPYMSLEEAILRDLGKQHDVFLPRTWERNSYTGYALILVAASRLLRQDLESLWYPITSLVFQEFIPVRQYQILLWQNQTGTMVQKMVPRPSSWGELCKEARDTTKMSRAFVQMQHWLPYFLLVYPHRFGACRVLALVEAVRRGSVQPV